MFVNIILIYFISAQKRKKKFILKLSHASKQVFLDKLGNKLYMNHRCTRVENPGGGGVLEVFAKIPRGGGQGFQEKLPGGVHLFCILLHFY